MAKEKIVDIKKSERKTNIRNKDNHVILKRITDLENYVVFQEKTKKNLHNLIQSVILNMQALVQLCLDKKIFTEQEMLQRFEDVKKEATEKAMKKGNANEATKTDNTSDAGKHKE